MLGFLFARPACERARLMLDGDGNTLNSCHRKIVISSTHRPGFQRGGHRGHLASQEWCLVACREGMGELWDEQPQVFAYVSDWTITTKATLAICDVASLILLRIIWIITLRCQEPSFRAILQGVGRFVGACDVLKRHHGGRGYFWICNYTMQYSWIQSSLV